ncbi:MAG: imelysin family protein [Alphaproteobacteria bacterium]
MRMCLWLAAMIAAASALPARGDDGAVDFAALNRALVESQAIPRYAAFAESAAALAAAVPTACPGDVDALHAAFDTALDDWMLTQPIGLGPVQFQMRGPRVDYWPDRRNTGARQLDDMLRNRPPVPGPAELAAGSVALQGFPALERLLYAEQADGLDDYECALAAAIAGNIAAIGAEMAGEWTAPGGEAEQIFGAGTEASYYADHADATTALFKGLYQMLEVVLDQKIEAPLGDAIDAAKPRLAENWRSGRSLRNVVLNLQAAQALFDGSAGDGFDDALAAAGAGALAAEIDAGLADALRISAALTADLPEAVADPALRPQVEALRDAVDRTRDLVGAEMGGALGLQRGFNSLDGD